MAPCRCLLREDADQQPLYRVVAEVVAALPEEQRLDGDAYAARLAACKACAHLLSGTCALCGCYVEVRCAKRRMACPDVPPRWTAEGVWPAGVLS